MKQHADPPANGSSIEREILRFDREKWKAEISLKKKELALASGNLQNELERLKLDIQRYKSDTYLRRKELSQKVVEVRRNRWTDPLIVTIIAASVAAIANIGATFYNGMSQYTLEDKRYIQNRSIEDEKSKREIDLEERKAEAARILEVVKTADPDKAAINLKVLIDTYLIGNPTTRAHVQAYLSSRKKGEGLALPIEVISPLPAKLERTVVSTIRCDQIPEPLVSQIKKGPNEGLDDLDFILSNANLPGYTSVININIIPNNGNPYIDVTTSALRSSAAAAFEKMQKALSDVYGPCKQVENH